MDLIKKLTGKNPTEYEVVAKTLVNNSDVELFAKLVKQDDFLFDFVKENVAKRIQSACNKDNYLNLFNFLKHYSTSYVTMITSVLHRFGGEELLPKMKDLYFNGTLAEKAYAVKYFSLVSTDNITEILPNLRETANSDFEPLSLNSIEILSILNDENSKAKALDKLNSEDEFEQYDSVKFLVNYQAKDCLDKIIDVMKKSSLSENIASEIPYLIPLEDLIEQNFEAGALVLCNIINAIPEIIPASAVCDYNLYEIFDNLPLNSSSSVLLRLAKEKFEELTSNEEYLFDCDKNTKDEVYAINELLKKFNNQKLESLLYEELFDESDFVFFAIDFVDEVEELEALLDSKNQMLVLKTLSILKDKGFLKPEHKEFTLKNITNSDIKNVIEVL